MPYPAGRRNSLTDVPGVRVSHLTLRANGTGVRPVRTGLTAIFTCPPDGNGTRPAAIVTVGGRTEITGLNFIDDFGFLTGPIVATSMRSFGRVYDAMLSRRTRVALGWPPIVVGFDDGRMNDQRRAVFTDEDVAKTLDEAADDRVPEGAVGAAAGLVAFGFKSGVGSASRQVAVGTASHVVGTLVLLNLGRREALRLGGTAARLEVKGPEGPSPLRGSALVVVATDVPLDDRQCHRVAETCLQGVGRLGAVPLVREGLIACTISTGVLLTRNDRSAPQVEIPHSSEVAVAAVADAAVEAVEEASLRSLTSVGEKDGTTEYPAVPLNQVQKFVQGR
jgi:D-aminopeptidase